MAAIDEPERYMFVRDGVPSGVSQVAQELADWTRCLEGPALERRMGKSFSMPAWTKRPAPEPTMTVGITRRGKAFNAGNSDNG